MKKFLDKIKRKIKRNKFVIWSYSVTIGRKRNKNLKKNGMKVLSIVHKSLVNAEIDYFLDYGTLLGFKRDGKFIEGDMDVDLGVFLEEKRDIRKLVFDTMINNGFKVFHKFVIEGVIFEESYTLDDVKVDFFYYFKNDEQSNCYSFYREPSEKYPTLNDFSVYMSTYERLDSFMTIEIEGFEFSVPQNIEDILSQKYNDDWHIRNSSWKFEDAKSIKKTNLMGKRVV